MKRVIWCKSKRNRHHLVYARFFTIGAGCNFSRAWYRLPVFPCLHRMHILPHLTLVAIFPGLGTVCQFSRAWHWLPVFPRLAPSASFTALGMGFMFSCAWHQLWPRLNERNLRKTRKLLQSKGCHCYCLKFVTLPVPC